jgi:mannose-6-phosphate isomerase
MTEPTPGAPSAPKLLGESDLFFPLLMKPCFDPKPWGGRRLAERFHKPLPDGAIGESWEISTTGGKVSRVEGGPLDGTSLDEILRRWPNATLGRLAGQDFPLLVKFIDAAESLSVQVHPDDATAQRLENFPRGKTEAWIVLDARGLGVSPKMDAAAGSPHAAHDDFLPGDVIHGLIPGTTRAQLAAVADSPEIERHLRRVPIRRGTVVPVTAGTVHAILAGTLLCEVQQASDITYRLYDWDRKPKRPLHVEQSLESIDFTGAPPDLFDLPPHAESTRRPRPVLDMKFFSLSLIDLPGGGSPVAEGGAGPDIATGGAGRGERAGDLRDADGQTGGGGEPVSIDMADGDFALAIVLDDGGGTIDLAGEGADDAGVPSLTLRAGRSVFIPAASRGVVFHSTAPARILWIRP